jgi:hypothetical protein
MTHFLQIAKSFKIKNRQGNLVTLPAHYKLTGKANCYTKQLVEVMDVLCDADEELIEETGKWSKQEALYVEVPEIEHDCQKCCFYENGMRKLC